MSRRVVLLSGSPSARSRSSALLHEAAEQLRASGFDVELFQLTDFPPEALVFADFRHPAVRRFQDAVTAADGLVVGTPIFKAAYSGTLKLLLDLLPERALSRTAVLPIATGGTLAHMLAIDYALQPVLSALKAQRVLSGVYATDADLVWNADDAQRLDIAGAVRERLGEALGRFAGAVRSAAPRAELLEAV